PHTHPTTLVCRYRAHRDLHSFPTRRSSDLQVAGTYPTIRCEALGRTPPINKFQCGEFKASLRHKNPFFHFPGLICSKFPLSLASDRKSTRLNSSHVKISYAVFCLKKKKEN